MLRQARLEAITCHHGENVRRVLFTKQLQDSVEPLGELFDLLVGNRQQRRLYYFGVHPRKRMCENMYAAFRIS